MRHLFLKNNKIHFILHFHESAHCPSSECINVSVFIKNLSKIFKCFIYKKRRRVWNWRIHSSLERVLLSVHFPIISKNQTKFGLNLKAIKRFFVTSWCLFLLTILSFKMESQISKKNRRRGGKEGKITNDFHVLLSVFLFLINSVRHLKKLSERRTHIHTKKLGGRKPVISRGQGEWERWKAI